MNDFKVVMPLVKRKKSILHKAFAWVGVILLITSFVKLSTEGSYIYIVFLFVGILLLNLDYLIKDYNIVGSISLFSDRISIEENSLIQEYLIIDIRQLEVFLLGVKGEFYRGKAITTKLGVSNIVKFKHNEVVEEIVFLLEQHKVEQLSQIINSGKRTVLPSHYTIKPGSYSRLSTSESSISDRS
ncbi:hypothetical protein MKQ70_00045 [Chitinophaga sedimenti]|uniref:hypothetical protein n=1 Tax=Chitinophaga sedimenti TaxID=2033606 RepID=UPI0020063690|nr:hypothetical protein [Chitinophaga sedimenti]MCK7553478.1 hypothetical protein [Chitinophaga sedimenti]